MFIRRTLDTVCAGKLPEPVDHDGVDNTHRLCLVGMDGAGGVSTMMLNRDNVWHLRRLLGMTFPNRQKTL